MLDQKYYLHLLGWTHEWSLGIGRADCIFMEKKPRISGYPQFRPVLFKGQLYIRVTMNYVTTRAIIKKKKVHFNLLASFPFLLQLIFKDQDICPVKFSIVDFANYTLWWFHIFFCILNFLQNWQSDLEAWRESSSITWTSKMVFCTSIVSP